jgi:hypothetical protein
LNKPILLNYLFSVVIRKTKTHYIRTLLNCSLKIDFNALKIMCFLTILIHVIYIFREFKIQCEGIGVHPPLELSHQVIHFAATALYDVSSATAHVVNSHTSTNEFN